MLKRQIIDILVPVIKDKNKTYTYKKNLLTTMVITETMNLEITLLY